MLGLLSLASHVSSVMADSVLRSDNSREESLLLGSEANWEQTDPGKKSKNYFREEFDYLL